MGNLFDAVRWWQCLGRACTGGFAVGRLRFLPCCQFADKSKTPRYAGSGAGYYVVPAGEISLIGPVPTPHNSFSNPIDGFFEPGGTKVWQAEAAFEWLLGAAFGP